MGFFFKARNARQVPGVGHLWVVVGAGAQPQGWAGNFTTLPGVSGIETSPPDCWLSPLSDRLSNNNNHHHHPHHQEYINNNTRRDSCYSWSSVWPPRQPNPGESHLFLLNFSISPQSSPALISFQFSDMEAVAVGPKPRMEQLVLVWGALLGTQPSCNGSVFLGFSFLFCDDFWSSSCAGSVGSLRRSVWGLFAACALALCGPQS